LFSGIGDRPLIVQFAAKNATDLANVSEMVAPYVSNFEYKYFI